MLYFLLQLPDDLHVFIIHGATPDDPGVLIENSLFKIGASSQGLHALKHRSGKGHARWDSTVSTVCLGQDFVYFQGVFELSHEGRILFLLFLW